MIVIFEEVDQRDHASDEDQLRRTPADVQTNKAKRSWFHYYTDSICTYSYQVQWRPYKRILTPQTIQCECAVVCSNTNKSCRIAQKHSRGRLEGKKEREREKKERRKERKKRKKSRKKHFKLLHILSNEPCTTSYTRRTQSKNLISKIGKRKETI